MLAVCSFFDGQFVSDATYADGSCVAPGITLTKTWIVLNTGSVAWTPTTTKVYCYSVSCNIITRLLYKNSY